MDTRSHVEFRSSEFPPLPEEDEEINPGVFGRRLADYICSQLAQRGVRVAKPGYEDWGVRIDLQEPDLPVWISCSNYAEYEDGFLCIINPSRPALFRMFAKADTLQAITRVADLLDSILADTPSVRDIKWWDGQTPV